jgi:hypothetical protein
MAWLSRAEQNAHMTFEAADPVSSGRPYRILVTGAGTPTDLTQFAEETRFTIDKDGVESMVHGYGAPAEGGVRFYEKDVGSGKDVRTWHISQGSDGHFTAEPASAY